MKYEKPALTVNEQVTLLQNRGMAGDPLHMAQKLGVVNYYRLSGYWFPFRQQGSDDFAAGTEFETVWMRYVFDRRLRLLIMDALERIEVFVRTQVGYRHALVHGPFGYADNPSSLPKMSLNEHSDFISRIRTEVARSRERFVDHFKHTYRPEHRDLPVWVATEIMSFGTLVRLYRKSDRWDVQRHPAQVIGVPEKVLESWLLTFNASRNVCAHHGRLWNRGIRPKPKVPRHPDWQTPVVIPNNTTFTLLTICGFVLSRISRGSAWKQRLFELLAEYPEIPLRQMGFPDDWRQSPLWQLPPQVSAT